MTFSNLYFYRKTYIPPPQAQLVPCWCGRTFFPERLAVHQKGCKPPPGKEPKVSRIHYCNYESASHSGAFFLLNNTRYYLHNTQTHTHTYLHVHTHTHTYSPSHTHASTRMILFKYLYTKLCAFYPLTYQIN